MLKIKYCIFLFCSIFMLGCAKNRKVEFRNESDDSIVNFRKINSSDTVSLETKLLENGVMNYSVFNKSTNEKMFSFDGFMYGDPKMQTKQLEDESYFVCRTESDHINKIVCVVDKENSCAHFIKTTAMNFYLVPEDKILIQCYANPLKIELNDYSNRKVVSVFEDSENKFTCLYPQTFTKADNKVVIEYGADTTDFVTLEISLSNNEIKVLEYDVSDYF